MENSQITVLVVDDEDALRKGMVRILEMEDFKVLSASSGDEAFKCIIKASPKVNFVFSDIRMPNGDGVSLLERVRAFDKALPVVLLVTGQSNYSKAEVVAKGAIDLLAKPVDIEKIIELIKSTASGV